MRVGRDFEILFCTILLRLGELFMSSGIEVFPFLSILFSLSLPSFTGLFSVVQICIQFVRYLHELD